MTRDPVRAREQAYPPIGGQLDAVMKGFKALAGTGVQLPPETAARIAACEAVKARYPKAADIAQSKA